MVRKGIVTVSKCCDSKALKCKGQEVGPATRVGMEWQHHPETVSSHSCQANSCMCPVQPYI